jgi:hypothetical protein
MTQRLRDALWAAELDEAYDPDDGRLTVFTPHSRDLTPGVIDGEAEAYFGYGACALLALEAHRLTGWPLTLVRVRQVNDDPDHTFVHTAVKRPDGLLVDIHGARSADEVLKEWQCAHPDAYIETCDGETDFLGVVGSDFDAFAEYELAAAHDFAALVCR